MGKSIAQLSPVGDVSPEAALRDGIVEDTMKISIRAAAGIGFLCLVFLSSCSRAGSKPGKTEAFPDSAASPGTETARPSTSPPPPALADTSPSPTTAAAATPPAKVKAAPPPKVGMKEIVVTETKKEETLGAKGETKKLENKLETRVLPPPVAGEKAATAAEKIEKAPPTGDSTPGQLAWRPPRAMTVGKTELVEARLSADTSRALTDGLQGSGAVETHDLQITPHMRVRLEAPVKDDFDIRPLNCPDPSSCEDQRVFPGEINTWAWSVTPLRSGDLSLILTASMLFGEEAHALPSLRETITVGVSSPGYYVKRFVAANWQWLWAAILVPLAGWIFSRRKAKP
jgi:hypothetical protein